MLLSVLVGAWLFGSLLMLMVLHVVCMYCRYSEELGKWMEVGNSGMFRPEMLQPMGLPPDVNVIAWGLSLERPTMILYGIDNIRDLFGHKVSLSMVKTNPICRMGL